MSEPLVNHIRKASKLEATEWCLKVNADFQTPVYPPPQGWMWHIDGEDSICLVNMNLFCEQYENAVGKEKEDMFNNFSISKNYIVGYKNSIQLFSNQVETVNEDDDMPASDTYDEVEEIMKEHDVDKGCAFDVWYLRTRSRHTEELEAELVRLHKVGQPPNVMEFGCTEETGKNLLDQIQQEYSGLD